MYTYIHIYVYECMNICIHRMCNIMNNDKNVVYAVKRTNQQPTNWEKFFTNTTSDRGLIPNVYKELKKLDPRKPKNSIKNGVQS